LAPFLLDRWDWFVGCIEPTMLDPIRVELDPTIWGGGLHVTESGGWLNGHLDYDRCPKIPTHRRALNAIGFLNPEWREEWGGAFCLYNPMGEVVKRIYPEPGMVLAFECSDLSYHGVEKVTGPVERITLAAYFLSPAGPEHTRMRAMFFPARGK
jgi:Rps23 Pro-64 3,4-dihydroxylase Tpa1-like proline 4-hydroxylase